jgi:hypothetical protein
MNTFQKYRSAQILLGSIATSVMFPIAAQAATFFNFTGSIDTFTVPTTGVYRIDANGAQGSPVFGGLGGNIAADFNLSAGEILRILAGGTGINSLNPGSRNSNAGGGGGGTFVVLDNAPLVIAGGGGGGAGFANSGTTGGGGGGGFSTSGNRSQGNGDSSTFGGFGGNNTFGGGNGTGGSGNGGGNGGGGFVRGFVNNPGGSGGSGGSFSFTTAGNGGKGSNIEQEDSPTVLEGGNGGIGGYDPARLADPNSLVTTNGSTSVGNRFNGRVSIDFLRATIPPAPTAVPEPLTVIGTIIGGTAAMRLRKKLKSTGEE